METTDVCGGAHLKDTVLPTFVEKGTAHLLIESCQYFKQYTELRNNFSAFSFSAAANHALVALLAVSSKTWRGTKNQI